MADPWKAAQEGIDETKLAHLNAVARYGSEGSKRFEAARSNIGNEQQAAVERALANSAGLTSTRAGQVGDAYGQNLSALANYQSGFEGNMADRAAAMESFFGKTGAALPIIKGRMDEKHAMDKAKLERDLALRQQGIEGMISAQEQANEAARLQAEADAQWEAEKRAHERASWAADAASASAEASGAGALDEMSDSELGNYLFGAGRNAKVGEFENIAASPAKGLGQMLGKTRVMGTTNKAAGREIGLASGIDPNRVMGLPALREPGGPKAAKPVGDVKNIAKFVGGDLKTAEAIAKDPEYSERRNEAASFLTYADVDEDGLINDGGDYDGLTPWDAYVKRLADTLLSERKRSDGSTYNKLRTYTALIGEFKPVFQSSGRS